MTPAAMHDDEDDEDILVVRRHKRSRPVAKDGAVDGNSDDTSPRGPIDASQADSPVKSSDDEQADEQDGLPGNKKFKLRRKGAIEEEEKEKAANVPGEMPDDSDLELDLSNGGVDEEEYEEEDVVYGSDDEEGQMEVMLKQKGTLDGFGLDDDAADGSGEDDESDESDLEDSEDERELQDEVERLKAEAAKRTAEAAKAAKPPPRTKPRRSVLSARRPRPPRRSARLCARLASVRTLPATTRFLTAIPSPTARSSRRSDS